MTGSYLDEAQTGCKSFFSNEFRIETHPFNIIIDLTKIIQSFFGRNKFKCLHVPYFWGLYAQIYRFRLEYFIKKVVT